MKFTYLILILFLFISCNQNNEFNKRTKVKSFNETENNEIYHINFLQEYYKKEINLKKTRIFEFGDEFIYSFRFKSGNNNCSVKEFPSDLKGIDSICVKVINHGNSQKEQRALQYTYPPKLLSASSLIIENDSLVWIHPPRMFFFKILELNPFPSIFKKEKRNYKWEDSLVIGSQYSDPRWAVWEKNLINKTSYVFDRDTILDTKLGELRCKKIYGLSKNIKGTSSLTSYFNETYGFVLLEYVNIDGTELILELINYNKRGNRKSLKKSRY